MGNDIERLPTTAELEAADEVLAKQPRRRGDCPPADIPCPFIACRYHLWTHATIRNGEISDVQIARPWGNTAYTCALNQADKGPCTLEEIGQVMGLTRERVRQLENGGKERLRRRHSEALRGTLSDVNECEFDGIGGGALGVESDRRAAPSETEPPATRRSGPQTTGKAAHAQRQASYAARRRGKIVGPCPVCGKPMHERNTRGEPAKTCDRSGCPQAWARRGRGSPALGPSEGENHYGYREAQLNSRNKAKK